MQIFPNTESVIRLVGALLVEMNDEMIAADRRFIAAGSVAALLDDDDRLPFPPSRTPYLTTDARSYTTPLDAIPPQALHRT